MDTNKLTKIAEGLKALLQLSPDEVRALRAAEKATRTEWVDLGADKRVGVIRPTELESVALLRKGDDGVPYLAAGAPEVKKYVVAWEGFYESDLIGAAGSSDAIAFDPELWSIWIDDHRLAMKKVAQKIVDLVAAHEAAAAAAEKN